MSIWTGIGALCVFVLITLVGIYAGRKIRSATDFSVGKGMSASVTAGSLVGTLVGGASTIGTAQLAFTHGFSAWWYTLGGGIGLCVMALWFAAPLRASGCATMPQILTKEYGKKVATAAAVLMSLGTFVSIVSQMISGAALVTSVASVPVAIAVALTAVLMVVYVLFGGAWGAGLVGRVKTILLYGLMMLCAVVALWDADGRQAMAQLPAQQYYHLFSRGFVVDGGAGLSLIFGVMTTQAYFLPVISAKDLRTSRRGGLIGGVLTVIIGAAGVLVGLYMRVAMPQTPSSQVLPMFVLTYLPDLPAGIVLATLLVTLVGTGAGLALGISTMLTMDIYMPYLRPDATGRQQLRFSRSVLAAVLLLAAVLATGEAGSMILQWSFLSMGLRGTVAFMPVLFALFFPGCLPKGFVIAAIAAAPAVTMASFFWLKGIDPLFPGMAVSVLICLCGCTIKRSNRRKDHRSLT